MSFPRRKRPSFKADDRAGTGVEEQYGMDEFADLEPPKLSRLTESDKLLDKVLKDRKNKEQALQKRARVLAERQETKAAETAEPAVVEEEVQLAKFEGSKEAFALQGKARAAPPAQRRCLFPSEVPEVEHSFPEDNELVAAYQSLLGDQSSFVDSATMAHELLLGGWTQQHYTRRRALPPELQAHLLKLVARSPVSQVVQRAFDVLVSTLGCSGDKDAAHFGRLSPLPSGTGFYGPMAAAVQSSWCLSDAHFASALAALGYNRSRAQERKLAGDGGASDAPTPEGSGEMPRLHSLRLVVQILTLAAKAQEAGKCKVLSGGGLRELLTAMLDLRMDPATCLLATELDAALTALLEAFSESDWAANVGPLAGALAGVGGSHRGAVEAIRLLQGTGSRANLLCSLAAAQCLSTLLRPEGEQEATPAESSTAVDPEDVLSAQPWFDDGAGPQRLAQRINKGAADVWELHSAIELVDMLLSGRLNDGGAGRRQEAVVAKWHGFCQKLSSHVTKDDQGVALKLLITTIVTRGRPQGV